MPIAACTLLLLLLLALLPSLIPLGSFGCCCWLRCQCVAHAFGLVGACTRCRAALGHTVLLLLLQHLW